VLANALVTVTAVGADPTVTPPAVADTEMFVLPAATPVTSPELLIVAFAITEELHVSADAIALPNWSFALAVNWSVEPTATELDGALIVTVVSTGVAVIVMTTLLETVTPFAVASTAIVAVPAATPVTSPLADPTVAMPGADELHTMLAFTIPPL
jgi:hypothetical protein